MQPSQISYQAGISDLCFWSTLTVALNGVSAVWSVIPQANLPGGTQWKHPTISWLISIAGSLEAHLSFPRPQILLPSIQQQEKVIVYEWWRQPPIGLSASCLAISSSSLLLLWWLLPLLCHLPVATLLILSAFPSHILPPQALHFKPEWAPATDALPLPLSPHSPEPQIFCLSFHSIQVQVHPRKPGLLCPGPEPDHISVQPWGLLWVFPAVDLPNVSLGQGIWADPFFLLSVLEPGMGKAPSISKEILVCNTSSTQTSMNRRGVWPEYWDIPWMETKLGSRAPGDPAAPCLLPSPFLSVYLSSSFFFLQTVFSLSQFLWQKNDQ